MDVNSDALLLSSLGLTILIKKIEKCFYYPNLNRFHLSFSHVINT